MLIPLIGAGALVGYYLYKKSHVTTAVEAAHETTAAQADAAPPPADGMTLPPVTKLAGFNTLAQSITVKAPASMAINYPPATTSKDPNIQKTNVIRYQNAAPIPSGKSYYPAKGDLWTIVVARLGGTAASRLKGEEKTSIMKTIPVSDLGKLNGFVAYADMQKWLDDGKPLMLPSVASDVSGPVPAAMGSVR